MAPPFLFLNRLPDIVAQTIGNASGIAAEGVSIRNRTRVWSVPAVARSPLCLWPARAGPCVPKSKKSTISALTAEARKAISRLV